MASNLVKVGDVKILILEGQSYDFSEDYRGETFTITSTNSFKNDPGIGGLVLDTDEDPVEGATVNIYDNKNKLVTTLVTDEDGWYMWQAL